MKSKICVRCKQSKDVSDFRKFKANRDGLQSYCNECQKEYNREYRKNNPRYAEQHKEESARYRNKHVEQVREILRKWYFKNVTLNRQRNRSAMKIWRSENKEKIKMYEENRRALILGVEGNGITVEEWETIKNEASNRCSYCGQKSNKLQMDHVVPVSKGGSHNAENIVPACPSCNQSKGNRGLLKFLYNRNESA
jgi:5-methylcytosine-specific restriction endonuclease McrA